MTTLKRLLALSGTLILTLVFLIILGPSSHAAAADCFNPYAVGPTESWHSIAKVCHIDYDALRAANPDHIRYRDILYTGELLDLPDQEKKPPAGLTTYTVQPGDSWYRIAQNHGLTFRDVRAFNPHLWRQRGEIIHPGDLINLPLLVPASTDAAGAVDESASEAAVDASGCPVEVNMGAAYSAGGTVVVAGDAPLDLYANEGDLTAVAGQVAPGTTLQVLTDPSCISGWLWWQVKDEGQDLTGWAAADLDAKPVLDPAP